MNTSFKCFKWSLNYHGPLCICVSVLYDRTLRVWLGLVRPAGAPLSEHQGAAPQLLRPGLDCVEDQRTQHL